MLSLSLLTFCHRAPISDTECLVSNAAGSRPHLVPGVDVLHGAHLGHGAFIGDDDVWTAAVVHQCYTKVGGAQQHRTQTTEGQRKGKL